MPESAVRGCILRCAAHLRIAASLAEVAASGPDPVDGAEHIVGVVDDLRSDLTFLRAVVRSQYQREG
jgi:hypothetical protein